jgi:hypothetical protein
MMRGVHQVRLEPSLRPVPGTRDTVCTVLHCVVLKCDKRISYSKTFTKREKVQHAEYI